MPSTFKPEHTAQSTIENIQTAVDSSFNTLQTEIQNINEKQVSSRSEIETDISRVCDGFLDSVKNIISKTKNALVSNIPSEMREAQSWRKNVLPQLGRFFVGIGYYVKWVICEIINFFVGLWDPIKKGLKWIGQKVSGFFAYLKQGFMRFFAYEKMLAN